MRGQRIPEISKNSFGERVLLENTGEDAAKGVVTLVANTQMVAGGLVANPTCPPAQLGQDRLQPTIESF
jgi:hypothetical protein